MSKVTVPKNMVPVGFVQVGNQRYEVQQHPEFVRFFFDLFQRVGGTAAASNSDLEQMAEEQVGAGQVSSPEAQEAVRGVDELRNQLASLRSDVDMLRGLIEQAGEALALRAVDDLRARVEQIEGRLL